MKAERAEETKRSGKITEELDSDAPENNPKLEHIPCFILTGVFGSRLDDEKCAGALMTAQCNGIDGEWGVEKGRVAVIRHVNGRDPGEGEATCLEKISPQTQQIFPGDSTGILEFQLKVYEGEISALKFAGEFKHMPGISYAGDW